MIALSEVIAYVLKYYPSDFSQELSNARVTKMIYLADWHQSITRGTQITNINWYFDSYGPYVPDIKKTVESAPQIFDITLTNNSFGYQNAKLALLDKNYMPKTDIDSRISLDHVIETTKGMKWDEFIRLVYSTYPIVSSDRYSFLDLVSKAKSYRKIM
jgi:hypothetical protein